MFCYHNYFNLLLFSHRALFLPNNFDMKKMSMTCANTGNLCKTILSFLNVQIIWFHTRSSVLMLNFWEIFLTPRAEHMFWQSSALLAIDQMSKSESVNNLDVDKAENEPSIECQDRKSCENVVAKSPKWVPSVVQRSLPLLRQWKHGEH